MAKEPNPKDKIIIENVLRLIKLKGWNEAGFCRKISEYFNIKFEQTNFNSLKSGIRGIGNLNLKRFSEVLNVEIGFLTGHHNKDPIYQIGKNIATIMERLTIIEKTMTEHIKIYAKSPEQPEPEWGGTERRHSERRREGGGKK